MLGHSLRTTLKKAAHKASTETTSLHAIIDESLIAHIAIIEESGSVVIPMLAWRVDDYVYIHGANNSRLMRHLHRGEQTCLTFTLFDGWVLARSAFHHSAHYRSAVVFGAFESIDESSAKKHLLDHFIEQIAPGRSEQARASNAKELAATMLLRMPLNEASVKISNKPVNDDLADMTHPVWAGYLPYSTKVGPLIAAEGLEDDITEPDYSAAYVDRWNKN